MHVHHNLHVQTFTIVLVFPIEGIYFVSTGLVVTLFIVSVIVSLIYWMLPWLLSLRGVEMRRHSLFGTALVFESEDEDGTPVRLLNVNGTFQSASYLSDELWSELVCEYHRTMAAKIDEMGRARSVLVIGGGGYSLPKYLVTHTQRMAVTAVEIDPRITQIARERFFLDRAEELSGGRLELVNADGWMYLRESDRSFDVIINDAFSGSKPLGALSNSEGAALIRAHLSDRGLYLANVRSPLTGRKAKTLGQVKEAFQREFSQVEVIPELPDEPEALANNVIVARV